MFAKFPQYRLVLPRPIIPPKGYPFDPKTIGEHIRKRRLDLGLTQIEVAKIIDVTESTVCVELGARDRAGDDPHSRRPFVPRVSAMGGAGGPDWQAGVL